jgi:methylated-DNA-[protein]-cysteine S-methyltransferase
LVNRIVPARPAAPPAEPARRALPADSALGQFDAPIGPLALAVTPAGLARLAFGPLGEITESADAPDQTRQAISFAEHPIGAQVLAQLTEYFADQRRDFELPLDWTLTGGVQRTILQTLHARVPYGRTVEYGELAVMSGRTLGASRLVGTVMGSNPIAIVVPCHRVVAADGLGGFGGGLETKRRLLTLEGVLQETLFDL